MLLNQTLEIINMAVITVESFTLIDTTCDPCTICNKTIMEDYCM